MHETRQYQMELFHSRVDFLSQVKTIDKYSHSKCFTFEFELLVSRLERSGEKNEPLTNRL